MGVFIFCEVIQSRVNPSQSLCVFEVIEKLSSKWGERDGEAIKDIFFLL